MEKKDLLQANLRALAMTNLQDYIQDGNLLEGDYLRGGRLVFFAQEWPTDYYKRV